jgi:hypothetical protein
MSNLTPQVTDVMLCSPAVGGPCTSTASGHAVSAIRERVTAATPGKWRDGTVSSASNGHWIGIDLVDAAETVWVWNHLALGTLVSAGEPVALHGLYGTLAVGSERFSVLEATL